MIEDILEEIQRRMLEAEQGTYAKFPNLSLEELVRFYHAANSGVLDSAEQLQHIVSGENKKFGKEACFSTFRILKAILAEIEYRIIENKI